MDSSTDIAVTTVFIEHREALVRLIAAHARDHDAAADLVDEAFARLVAEARRGDLPDAPVAWVYRVARNLLTSEVRHRRVAHRHAVVDGRLASTMADPADQAEARISLRTVAAALPLLRDRDRGLLRLAADEFTSREIARRTGRSSGATRTALCRSRAALRLAVGAA